MLLEFPEAANRKWIITEVVFLIIFWADNIYLGLKGDVLASDFEQFLSLFCLIVPNFYLKSDSFYSNIPRHWHWELCQLNTTVSSRYLWIK